LALKICEISLKTSLVSDFAGNILREPHRLPPVL
jgi:hypothetical protein